MDINIIQFVLVFVVAFLAGCEGILDEWQFHQPLVACTLIGMVLGDISTGIKLGGTLQLLALGWMNIGAAVAPDAALASVGSAILVIIGKQPIGVGIALALPIATAGQVLTLIVRAITVGIQHMADKSSEDGDLGRLTRLHLGALCLQGLRIAIPAVILVLTVQSNAVKDALNSIPAWLVDGLKVGGGIIVAVGYAMVINMIRAPGLMMFFFLGFVCAAFLKFNLIGFGVVGFGIAYYYIKIHPKYNQVAGVVVAGNQGANKLDNRLD